MGDTESKYSESLVSQELLDELMKEAESEDIPIVETEESKDLDLVSPEDIENLLRLTSDDINHSSEENEFEMISQDDIEALMSGEELSGPVLEKEDDDDDGNLISQDDIDALLGEAVSGDLPETDDNSEEPEDSLISQDDIDALLNGAVVDSGAEDDENDEEPFENLISQDDIDALLNGTDEDSGTDALLNGTDEDSGSDEDSGGEDDIISQDDIDSLLQVSEQEDSHEEKLISQDDIDKLLVDDNTDNKNFPDDSDGDPGEMLVSQDDIDSLLNADIEDIDVETEPADQVILEKSDDPDQADEKTGAKKWLGSKMVIACIVLVVLGVLSGTGLWFFSGTQVEETAVNASAEDVIEDPEQEIEEEIPETIAMRGEGIVTVEMKDFVVPAPLKLKDISYISLDLSIEIVDITSNPIKGYEPFFRNIIYEVLNKALMLQSESRIIEADLVRMIRIALDDALSEGSVGEINFLSFNLT